MALILIIDDSAYMRGKIRDILKVDGHEILEASDGIKGLYITATHKPDCILLDIIMPAVDGLKILKNLSEKDLKVPTIVVTADIQESTRKRCLELGAAAVINKPPKEDELRNTIIKVLSSRKETEK